MPFDGSKELKKPSMNIEQLDFDFTLIALSPVLISFIHDLQF